MAGIRVESIDPPPGAVITRASVVRAKLSYRIVRNPSGTGEFFVTALFAAKDRDAKERGGMLGGAQPVTTAVAPPAGTVEIEVPLDAAWDDPRLGEPLTVYFVLNERLQGTRSAIIGQSKPVSYPKRP
jgi:hypothetical protein